MDAQRHTVKAPLQLLHTLNSATLWQTHGLPQHLHEQITKGSANAAGINLVCKWKFCEGCSKAKARISCTKTRRPHGVVQGAELPKQKLRHKGRG